MHWGKFPEKFGKLPGNFLVDFSGPPGKVPGNIKEKISGNFPGSVPFGSNWIPLTHIASLYKHTVPFNHIDTFFTYHRTPRLPGFSPPV